MFGVFPYYKLLFIRHKMSLGIKQKRLKLIFIFLFGDSFVILVAWEFDRIEFPNCPISIKKLKLKYQFIVAKASTMHNKHTFSIFILCLEEEKL